MKLPIQSQPVTRKVSTATIPYGGIVPTISPSDALCESFCMSKFEGCSTPECFEGYFDYYDKCRKQCMGVITD